MYAVVVCRLQQTLSRLNTHSQRHPNTICGKLPTRLLACTCDVSLKEEGVLSAQQQQHYITDRSGPALTTTTTVVTILNNSNNSSPTAYTSKEHLVAPSSNPYPPAAPTAPCSTSTGYNSSNPSLAAPIRIVFSASLERSLQSSRRRRPSALRSSSSWTTGPLTRDSKKSTAVEHAASTTTSTRTTQLTKKRLGAPTHSAAARAGRREARGVTKRAASPRQWEHLKDNHRESSSEAQRHGGGGTTAAVEAIIDTSSSSPARPRRGRRNLHDPSSDKVRLSAVGASRGLARKEEEKKYQGQAEKTWVGNSVARQIVSLANHQQQLQLQQSEEGSCKGGREQQHSSSCRAPRSGDGTLPTVSCWEGSAVVISGAAGSGGGRENQTQRPRQRPVRSRSCVDTASPQRTENTGGKSSTGVTDGKKPRHNIEEGSSSGIALVGRTGEGGGFGRESSDSPRLHLQGRGGAGARAAHGNATGGGSGSFSSGMLLGDERRSASGAAAATASSTSPPPLLQLPVSSSIASEDAACCDLEDNLSVCSSLPPMAGSATITTDLIFEESSLEDSGASVSQASSTERNWNDNVGGGGGGAAKSEGGGGAGRGKRGGGGGVCRQRGGVSSEAFVRTR